MICLGFFVFLAAFSGVCSQIQLTQSGAEFKKPGESAKVTCKTSGYTFTRYHINWVLQTPGKALEWIGYVDPRTGGTGYAQAFQGRFTITRDTSISTAYLHLGSLRTEDTAMYYCVKDRYFDYWGQGTMVTVTTASATAPSVFPLTSCTSEVTTSQVIFGCLAQGYFPEPVTVTWSPNVGSSGVRTYPSVLQPSSGLYSLSSQVTVPASSWTSNTYNCTVEHPPTSSSISKEIPSREEPPKPQAPITPKVKIVSNTSRDPVQLACFISGFYPENLTVEWMEWMVDGQPRKLPSVTALATKDPNGPTYSTHCNASVSKADWRKVYLYTCQVSQPGTPIKSQGHTNKCRGDARWR